MSSSLNLASCLNIKRDFNKRPSLRQFNLLISRQDCAILIDTLIFFFLLLIGSRYRQYTDKVVLFIPTKYPVLLQRVRHFPIALSMNNSEAERSVRLNKACGNFTSVLRRNRRHLVVQMSGTVVK